MIAVRRRSVDASMISRSMIWCLAESGRLYSSWISSISFHTRGLKCPSHVCSLSSEMQPVPVRWMRKLGVAFFLSPDKMAAAQPGWSISPVSVRFWVLVKMISSFVEDKVYLRITISAANEAFSITSNASKSPTTISTVEYLSLNSEDGVRSSAVISSSAYFWTIASSTLPPM